MVEQLRSIRWPQGSNPQGKASEAEDQKRVAVQSLAQFVTAAQRSTPEASGEVNVGGGHSKAEVGNGE